MDSKKAKPTFMYDLPSPRSLPRVSNRNTLKMQSQEPKQEKYTRKHMEWPHDHQPPSSFYESSESNAGKRKRINSEQHSLSYSQSEVIPSSLQGYEEDAHAQRFSFRIAERMKRKQQFSGDDLGYTSPREYKNAVLSRDADIRFFKRANIQLKTQKEDLQQQAFNLKYSL
jgi:hypothetical protein